MLHRTHVCDAVLAVTLLALLAPAIQGQTNTWNNNSDASWNTAANWSLGTVPNAIGANVTFGSVITAPRTVTLSNGVTVGIINFDNAGFSYTIAGQPIVLNNGGTRLFLSELS